MKIVILDFSLVDGRASAHKLLAEKFGFPDYYGKNLDALHDCLGDICEETCIVLKNADDLTYELGNYGEIMLDILRYSPDENDYLTVVDESDPDEE